MGISCIEKYHVCVFLSIVGIYPEKGEKMKYYALKISKELVEYYIERDNDDLTEEGKLIRDRVIELRETLKTSKDKSYVPEKYFVEKVTSLLQVFSRSNENTDEFGYIESPVLNLVDYPECFKFIRLMIEKKLKLDDKGKLINRNFCSEFSATRLESDFELVGEVIQEMNRSSNFVERISSIERCHDKIYNYIRENLNGCLKYEMKKILSNCVNYSDSNKRKILLKRLIELYHDGELRKCIFKTVSEITCVDKIQHFFAAYCNIIIYIFNYIINQCLLNSDVQIADFDNIEKIISEKNVEYIGNKSKIFSQDMFVFIYLKIIRNRLVEEIRLGEIMYDEAENIDKVKRIDPIIGMKKISEYDVAELYELYEIGSCTLRTFKSRLEKSRKFLRAIIAESNRKINPELVKIDCAIYRVAYIYNLEYWDSTQRKYVKINKVIQDYCDNKNETQHLLSKHYYLNTAVSDAIKIAEMGMDEIALKKRDISNNLLCVISKVVMHGMIGYFPYTMDDENTLSDESFLQCLKYVDELFDITVGQVEKVLLDI